MNKIVNGYLDFITESKLELLLEAKIQFMPRFTKLINRIDSPITKALDEIIGKEVDVNTNFIDISTKDDSISFIPDDKIDSVNYVVTAEPYNLYYHLAQTARVNKTYPIGHVAEPMEGTVGKIIAQPTIEELNKIMPSDNWAHWNDEYRLVHFSWDNGKNNVFIKKSGLVLDVSGYKSTEYKVGKFINKILTKTGYVIGTHSNCDFSPVQIEDFVNKYKTQMKLRNNTLSRFEIVKGEDIRKYYCVDTYFAKKGSLGGSCMKGKYCQPFFDIFVYNPDQVSMVILRQEEGYVEDYVDEDTGEVVQLPVEDKITGRALLWTDNKGRKIMDRIYVIDTADIEFFKEFANKNGFLYKKDQDFNEDTPLMLNGAQLSKQESVIVVQLHENTEYENGYPYMDTLKYYTIKTGILTNSEEIGKNKDYYLEDTDGNLGPCSFCGGSAILDCPECLGTGNIECPDCEGVRRETCDFCDGEDMLPCPSCDGKDPNCDMCDGKGEVYCPECGGEGLIDCEKCGGAGDIQCTMCDGDGEVDCPECG
jgi:hypothetical protein